MFSAATSAGDASFRDRVTGVVSCAAGAGFSVVCADFSEESALSLDSSQEAEAASLLRRSASGISGSVPRAVYVTNFAGVSMAVVSPSILLILCMASATLNAALRGRPYGSAIRSSADSVERMAPVASHLKSLAAAGRVVWVLNSHAKVSSVVQSLWCLEFHPLIF